MDISGMVWVLIPLVAIVGGLSYAAFEKWTDIEERKQAAQASNGNDELHRRVRALESDLALMRSELVDRSQDIDERLMRVEILLREVG